MAFRKAKAEQAYLKMAIYGPSGSGKTLTSLLVAEGLAALTKGRVAFVDTEHGTDFYCQPVPERKIHPAGFDFDVVHTRSLTEVLRECQALRPAEYPVVVVDSITHLWEAAQAAYRGRRGASGQIPFHAWGEIKKPYKDLMNWALNAPQHVIFCGRQGNDWGTDDESGELVNKGFKLKAEGETAYEPHILVRLEAVRPRKGNVVHVAYVEKDRSSKLQGQIIEWPSFDTLARPLLGLLGQTQARVQTEEEAAQADAEALERGDREKGAESRIRREQFEARLTLAKTLKEAEAIGKEITPAKKAMTTADVAKLREAYLATTDRLKGALSNGKKQYDDPVEAIEREAIESEA